MILILDFFLLLICNLQFHRERELDERKQNNISGLQSKKEVFSIKFPLC